VVFVEGAGTIALGGQGGDHEAWVGALGQALGLGDDPAGLAPGLDGALGEVLEHPAGLAAEVVGALGAVQRLPDPLD
jgi:hypothetical protein